MLVGLKETIGSIQSIPYPDTRHTFRILEFFDRYELLAEMDLMADGLVFAEMDLPDIVLAEVDVTRLRRPTDSCTRNVFYGRRHVNISSY